jgi:hypothetical protein
VKARIQAFDDEGAIIFPESDLHEIAPCVWVIFSDKQYTEQSGLALGAIRSHDYTLTVDIRIHDTIENTDSKLENVLTLRNK